MTTRAVPLVALAMVAIGVGVSLYATMVPMASIGYRWRVDIVVTALSPYAIYILAAWRARNGLWLILGGVLIASELWLMGRSPLRPESLQTDYLWYLWSAFTSCMLLLVVTLVTAARHYAERGPSADQTRS
jgi:hypothetical protein